MKVVRYFATLLILHCSSIIDAQFLSHLNVCKSDALFTTYAAPPARSEYKTDQGYQFQWLDEESGVEFISKDGPNLGIAFHTGNRLLFKLEELYREPVVTTSYSDLVKYYYYPVKGLRVEVFFAVYSSGIIIAQFRMVNEGHFPLEISAMPYIYYPSGDSILDIEHNSLLGGYSFTLKKQRDPWMVEHKIPVSETLTGSYTLTGCTTLTGLAFVRNTRLETKKTEKPAYFGLIRSMISQKRNGMYIKGIISDTRFTLQPAEATSFRVMVNLSVAGCGIPGRIDLETLVKDDELAYSKIPHLNFKEGERDKELLYWSAFSLMRQCMMPAEGSCKHNYYVFSREPKWGWGYGGQVFHESLVMMAYAYMDPAGAMNSQRIFMERQCPDGYINYRTGPYLDETIETNGQPTSSAPWFNYENLEIYKVTGDKHFLLQAYVSGKKFYHYFNSNRDSNKNGLCEWGANAELESVRDARVAVWDKVGGAANFEGPDVNSMLVKEAKSLAEMATLLGFRDESKRWHEDAMLRSAMINETMWDPETRFYYNVTKSNQSFSYKSPGDLKIKEIIGFLPLWAGVTDKEKSAYLVEKMQDPDEFWRPYGIPSLTAASDYYCPIGYWNGPVWVQWEYLLFRGLRDWGYNKVAGELADKVLNNMTYHLKKDHVFWEFYSADDRQAGWNKTYIWAGIATRFIIDMSEPVKRPVTSDK